MVYVSIMMLNEVVVTVYVLSYDYSSILLACLRSGWVWGDFGATLQVLTSFLEYSGGSRRGPPWGAAAVGG